MAIRQGRPKEDIKCYEFINTKKIHDSDGFWTDYTWYHDTKLDEYIFILGDIDIYPPDRDNADWVSVTFEDAKKWFECDCWIID